MGCFSNSHEWSYHRDEIRTFRPPQIHHNISLSLSHLANPHTLLTVITDPEDPKFDLEALVNSWADAKQ